MDNLLSALEKFKAETGREVYVYDSEGRFKLSTTGAEHDALTFAPHFPEGGSSVSDRIEDVTYFAAGGGLIGVIDGSRPSDRDCGCALSLMLSMLRREEGRPLTRAQTLKKLLLGEQTPDSGGFDGAYFILRLRARGGDPAALWDYLAAVSGPGDAAAELDDGDVMFLKRCDPDGDEYRSANEFAGVLHDSLKEELRASVDIAVGAVAHGASEFAGCCRQTEFAMNLGLAMDSGAGVYGYKEYALVRLLQEYPTSVLRRYYDMLVDKDFARILSDGELIGTAEAFFKNDLNVSETGRNMYLHRNTLIYRLDKIEKATGLNIRRFPDALTLKVVAVISRLLSQKEPAGKS